MNVLQESKWPLHSLPSPSVPHPLLPGPLSLPVILSLPIYPLEPLLLPWKLGATSLGMGGPEVVFDLGSRGVDFASLSLSYPIAHEAADPSFYRAE